MKKFQIVFSLLLAVTLVNFVSAQSITPANNQPVKTDVKTESAVPFTIVEEMPSFPGGEEKLRQFLADNIIYPKEALDNKKEGTVYLSFIVDESGKITNLRIVKRMAYGMDHEAMRVVKMMPDWIPGKHQGKPLAVQYTLPVKFSLSPSEEK